jgi:hypothetical protein
MASPDLQQPESDRPFMRFLAEYPPDHQGIRLLLKLGLRLGGPDNYGHEALRTAALHTRPLRRSNMDTVKLLIQEGVKFDNTTDIRRQIISRRVPSKSAFGGLYGNETQIINEEVVTLLKGALLRPES